MDNTVKTAKTMEEMLSEWSNAKRELEEATRAQREADHAANVARNIAIEAQKREQAAWDALASARKNVEAPRRGSLI